MDLVQGVFMYWVTSNLFSLGQSLVFKVPRVRRALNLPDLSYLRTTAKGLPIEAGKPIVTFSQPPRQRKANKAK